MEVSNTRQSEFIIAELTPSWIDLGVASQVRRRLWPLSSVCKIFCLFSCAYELYYCKELLVTVELLLLLQHKHEVVAKTALHHHPIHSTRQIDVGCQEDNIFALQRCDGLVHLHQVRHHLLKAALPFAASAGARTRIRSELASLLVIHLLS